MEAFLLEWIVHLALAALVYYVGHRHGQLSMKNRAVAIMTKTDSGVRHEHS